MCPKTTRPRPASRYGAQPSPSGKRSKASKNRSRIQRRSACAPNAASDWPGTGPPWTNSVSRHRAHGANERSAGRKSGARASTRAAIAGPSAAAHSSGRRPAEASVAPPPNASSARRIIGSPPRPPSTWSSWLPWRRATSPPRARAWSRRPTSRLTRPTVSGPRSTMSPVTTSAVPGGAVHAPRSSIRPARSRSRSTAAAWPWRSVAAHTVNASGMHDRVDERHRHRHLAEATRRRREPTRRSALPSRDRRRCCTRSAPRSRACRGSGTRGSGSTSGLSRSSAWAR